jgi:hypothetical protein
MRILQHLLTDLFNLFFPAPDDPEMRWPWSELILFLIGFGLIGGILSNS